MIEGYSFGNMQIQGQVYKDDLKICRGKVIYPWRRKSGHNVRVEDVKDILASDPEIIVLGQGQPGLMQCSQELREYLQQEGIELIVVPTSEAIDKFNDLYEQGRNICAGFHLTC